MSKKRRAGRKGQVQELQQALLLNGQAMEEDRKRKTWSTHDIKTIKPLTPTQTDMFHAWCQGDNICAHGSAGTGKTFLAFYLALEELFTQKYQKIILVRSAVPTRDIGFLPGTLEEKMQQYEQPYHDIMHELLGRGSTYSDMKEAGVVEFHSTSFLRGLTWDNAIVIVDEVENLTFHEIDNVMTRIGENTRIIFTGDTRQTDLDGSKRLGSEGLTQALKVFEHMKSFTTIQFSEMDIVRSDLVKSWIVASNQTKAA